MRKILPANFLSNILRLTAARIVFLYATFSVLWILLSGYLVLATVTDPLLADQIEVAKGLAFVAITSLLLFLLLKTWQGGEFQGNTRKPRSAAIGKRGKSRWPALLILLFLLVPLFGWMVTEVQRPQIEQTATANLQAMAELKTHQIENWINERSGDSQTLQVSEGFCLRVKEAAAGNQVAKAYVLRRLEGLLRAYGYSGASVYDENGVKLVGAGHKLVITPALQRLMEKAKTTGEVQFNGIDDDVSETMSLGFVVPLYEPQASAPRLAGIAVLWMPPLKFLLPYVEHWPGASSTGETLLVKPGDGQALYLRTSRYDKGRREAAGSPSATQDAVTAIALQQDTPGLASGADYRGIQVLAAYHPIKRTNWKLIVKQDLSEVYAPLKPLVLWVSLIEFFAILAITAALILLRRKHLQIARMEIQAESDQIFKHFYELPFLGMAIASPASKYLVHFNDHLCKILGYTRKELMTTEWTSIAHPDDLLHELEAYESVIDGEANEYQIEKRFFRPDGTTVCTALDAKAVRAEDGSVTYFVITVQDVTEQKQTSQRLRESEQNYRTLADSAPALIWTAGPDKRCNYFNKVWLEFTGRPLEQELGNGWTEGVHPDDFDYCFQTYTEAFDALRPFSMQYRLRRHDQAYRWLQDNGCPRMNDEGTFIGYIGYCIDITDQIIAKKLLEDSEARLRSMVQNLPMVLCTVDQTGVLTSLEGQALEKLGLKPEAHIGQSAFEIYSDSPQMLDGIRNAISGNSIHCEVQIKGHWFENVFQPFALSGQHAGAMVASMDITARKAVEAENNNRIRRLECLNRISGLAAQDSHELTDSALREIVQFSGSQVGYIYTCNGDAGTFTLKGCSDSSNNAPLYATISGGAASGPIHILEEVIRTRKPLVLNDLQVQTQTSGAQSSLAARAHRILAMPIIDGDRVSAILELANKGTDYEPSDIDQLNLIMDATWRLVEQRQAEDALRRVTRLLEVAQSMAHVGGWEMSAASQFQQWTDETFRILDLVPGSVQPSVDLSLSFYTPESKKEIEEATRRALSEGRNFDIEVDVITAKGSLRHLRAKAEAISESGKIGRIIGAIQDITAYKNIEKELRQHQEHLEVLVSKRTQEFEQARDTAERATKAKSAFLATMSHEIRTPITAVLGMAHLALRTDLSPKQKEYLDKIMISANMLLGVINDILDFSKIEAGRMELVRAEFRLGDVVEKIIAVTGIRAAEKKIEFLVRIAPNTPSNLIGDASRLAQILVNLCSNAVKFTDTGEIMLSVSRVSLPHAGIVELMFSVRDTGIGMDEAQKQQLFQPFSQADTSDTRRFGGTGLGLAICRQLVDLMGGRIWVNSERGSGSEFSFTVPLGLGPEPEPINEKPLLEAHGKHVLVVDGNENSRSILSGLLKGFGFDPDARTSAKSLLEEPASRGKVFDVVLMDWREPVEDAVELMSALRRTGPSVRLILMTSPHDGAKECLYTSAQADLEVRKPITASSLFDAISTALGSGPNARTPLILYRSTGTQHARLLGSRVLLVEDNAFNQQIAQELLESAGLDVTIAENGKVALDKAARERFDVVLMDIQMPVMGGLEATRGLRQLPDYGAVPIVAMTAHAMLDEQHQCVAAGMNDFMSKPIEPELLFRKLAFWISQGKPALSQESLAAPSAERDTASLPDDIAGISIETGLHYCNDKVDFYLKMLREFMRTKGKVAQELRRSIAAGELELARRTAHTMKSVAGSIGAIEVSQAAAEIEHALRNGYSGPLPELIDQFETRLMTVMNALNLAFPASPQALPHTAEMPPEPGKLRQLLATISENLDSDIGEVLSLLPELRAAVANEHAEEACRKFCEHVDNFDIDAAHASLGALLALLGTGENQA